MSERPLNSTTPDDLEVRQRENPIRTDDHQIQVSKPDAITSYLITYSEGNLHATIDNLRSKDTSNSFHCNWCGDGESGICEDCEEAAINAAEEWADHHTSDLLKDWASSDE